MSGRALILGSGHLGATLGRALSAAGWDCWSTSTTLAKRGPRVLLWDARERLPPPALSSPATTWDLVVGCVAPRPGQSPELWPEAAAQLARATVGHRIWISSTSVYDATPGAAVDESTPLNGGPLARAEQQLRHAADVSPLTILRLAGLCDDSLPGWQRRFRALTPLAGVLDPATRLNLIFESHVADAVVWSAAGGHSACWNLCLPDHPRRQSFYDAVATRWELPSLRFSGTSPGRGGGKRVMAQAITHHGFVYRPPPITELP